jgi:hypothetical protein
MGRPALALLFSAGFVVLAELCRMRLKVLMEREDVTAGVKERVTQEE